MPDGAVERRIPIPGGHAVALTFGGPDLKDLYVTNASDGAGAAVTAGPEVQVRVPRTAGVLRARSGVAGLPMARAGFRLG